MRIVSFVFVFICDRSEEIYRGTTHYQTARRSDVTQTLKIRPKEMWSL